LSMEIESFFNFVVGFEDTKEKKQTGLPLKLALSMLKDKQPDIKPFEVLMVGDSMERDVYPAKALGLKTAICKYGQKCQEEGASDYELNDIEELVKIVDCSCQHQC